jgi:hypothetical protein
MQDSQAYVSIISQWFGWQQRGLVHRKRSLPALNRRISGVSSAAESSLSRPVHGIR